MINRSIDESNEFFGIFWAASIIFSPFTSVFKYEHIRFTYITLKQRKQTRIVIRFSFDKLHIEFWFYANDDIRWISFSFHLTTRYPHEFHSDWEMLIEYNCSFPSRNIRTIEIALLVIRTCSTDTMKFLCSCKIIEKNGCNVFFIGSWVRIIPRELMIFYV